MSTTIEMRGGAITVRRASEDDVYQYFRGRILVTMANGALIFDDDEEARALCRAIERELGAPQE